MYQNLKTAKERSNPGSDKKKKKDKPKWIAHQDIWKTHGEKDKLKIKSSRQNNKIDWKESV